MDITANYGCVFVLFSNKSYNYISIQSSLEAPIFYGLYETKKLDVNDYEIETEESVDKSDLELFAEIVSDKSFILRLFTKDEDGELDDIEPFGIDEHELYKIAKRVFD